MPRICIAEGMALLLTSVLKRLAGRGGDPVVQLQTSFGSGKTHTMMAVWHAVSAREPASRLAGMSPILDRAGVTDLPRGRVAVIDGNALSPSQPREHGTVTANTLWGEMAWQLSREAGYALMAAADRDGTSPGKAVLQTLFERFSPCVVLMDRFLLRSVATETLAPDCHHDPIGLRGDRIHGDALAIQGQPDPLIG